MYKSFVHDVIAKNFLVIINVFLPYFLFNEFAHVGLAFPSTRFFIVPNPIPLQNCTNFASSTCSHLT